MEGQNYLGIYLSKDGATVVYLKWYYGLFQIRIVG